MQQLLQLIQKQKQQKQQQPTPPSPSTPPVVKTIAKKRRNKGGRKTRNLHAGVPNLPPMSPPAPDVTDEEFASKAQEFSTELDLAYERMEARRAAIGIPTLQTPGIDTITAEIFFRMADNTLNHIDSHMVEALVKTDAVMAYNARTIQRQLSIGDLFNGVRSLNLYQDKATGKNSHSIRLYDTLRLHVTGPKTLDDILCMAEYVRGLVEVMKNRSENVVRVKTLQIDLINTSFNLGVKVDLGATWDRVSKDETTGPPSMRAYQTTYRADTSPAVRYRLFINSVSSAMWPIVQIFESGSVIIAAKSFRTLAVAYEHVTRFALDVA